MKALVIGGAGFIGSHIADALIEHGYEVRVLDNLEPSSHPQGLPAYFRRSLLLLRGDARDRAALESALQGVELVFHQAEHKGSTHDYAKFFHSNVVSTALLFEIIREKRLPVRKVVIGSSEAVYGEGQYYCATHGLVLPEPRTPERMERGAWENECPQCSTALVPVLLREGRPNPATPYALSKAAQEQIAFRLGKELSIPVVALRYSNVEGPRRSLSHAFSGAFESFANALHEKKPPVVPEDGKQLRDYVHISDVVDANMLVLGKSDAAGQPFNVGSGRGVAALDLMRALTEKMGVPISPEPSGAYQIGEPRHSIPSISRLQALGWKPKKGLNEMLEDYIASLGLRGGPARHLEPPQRVETLGVAR